MKPKTMRCQRLVYGKPCKQKAIPKSMYCERHQKLFKNQTYAVGQTKFQGSKTDSRYQEYLESDQWKQRAKQERSFWNNRCVLCHRSQNVLHVHHSTYVRLGNEAHGDLVVLCNNCHEMFHKFFVYNGSVGYFVPKH
jgi:RNase P subunit RPR2